MQVLEERLLPSFANIEREAERVAGDALASLTSAPVTDDVDHSEIADAANQIGVQHYVLLSEVRQGLVNLFAVGLYHLFEQQLMLFYHKELFASCEKFQTQRLSISELKKDLLQHAIDLTQLSSWALIEELELLANTVKHAEGRSASLLKERRPDLFKQNGLPGLGEWELRTPRVVSQPLAGKDLYLSARELREYADALVRFWNDFSVAIQSP
jgi:hypothetical protein